MRTAVLGLIDDVDLRDMREEDFTADGASLSQYMRNENQQCRVGDSKEKNALLPSLPNASLGVHAACSRVASGWS